MWMESSPLTLMSETLVSRAERIENTRGLNETVISFFPNPKEGAGTQVKEQEAEAEAIPKTLARQHKII